MTNIPMAKDTGGSAFPVESDIVPDERSGMTLLDYFAGQVMVGICLNEKDMDFNKVDHCIAELSYKIARAMIAERGKQ